MCLVGLFGIILMIIDTELRSNQVNGIVIIFIRILITISTIFLVGLVLYYHAINIRLYTINNHIVDWRVTLSLNAILMIICEVLVCVIHPFPYVNQTSSNDFAWIDMFLTLPSKLFIV
jgi:hypothetical protein